jgi:hypothetical protein
LAGDEISGLTALAGIHYRLNIDKLAVVGSLFAQTVVLPQESVLLSMCYLLSL